MVLEMMRQNISAEKEIMREIFILLSQMQNLERISSFERIEKDFPQSSLVGISIFSEGYIYANKLNDYEKAHTKLDLYISKYGKAGEKLTQDAQHEIENLGLSDEQEFEKMMAKKDSLDKK